jgi:hypothetical protein
MSDKPSRNEDEYFAREDAERIRKLREKESAERVAAERKASYMKCPKCGADLRTETLHDIQIDRCPECNGIWLDNGEMEALMKHEDPGALRRIMGDLWGSLRKERPRK